MAGFPQDDDMAEIVISSLPLETGSPPLSLRLYRGFWIPEPMLPGIRATALRFEPRPSDVFLASFPKSGTTWLKALAFATMNRVAHPPRSPDHPLRHRNPHECVDFMEMAFAGCADGDDDDVFAELPSPRVLATHLPYPLLPTRIAAEGSPGKIVYVCRDPKDAFVSTWLFLLKSMAAMATTGAGDDPPTAEFKIEDAFELFCDGRSGAGPQWRHVAGYWEASRRWPTKVLFLKYEEMLQDPVGNVRKLAEFLGCAFSDEEEAARVVQDIVELCSIDALKNMEVNKSGSQKYFPNESFFRKGVAGDWSNHMTPAMAERLDRTVEEALQGTGFTFAPAQST